MRMRFLLILAAGTAALLACSDSGNAGPTEAAAPQQAAGPDPAADDSEGVLQKRLVDCELTVEGTTYIDEICEFSPHGEEGEFQISSVEYFAQVSIFGDGSAWGTWNGTPNATHAQTPLGDLTQDGACWVGKRARVCARALSPEAEKQARAAWPTAGWLRPDAPFYWQQCLGADGPLEAGAPIVLRPCKNKRDRIFELGEDGTLTIADRPDLCLDLEAPGMQKPPILIVNTCGAGPARFVHADGAGRSGAIRAPGGLCSTIPETEEEDGAAPYSVVMEPCEDSSAGVMAFDFTN